MSINLSQYTAIIFDAGDTLVQTWPSRKAAMCIRLKQAGISVDDAGAERMMNAIETAEREQIAREQNGAPRMGDDDFLDMVDRAAAEALGRPEKAQALHAVPLPQSELRVIDGVSETLSHFKKEGFRLAIVSNHYTWLRKELQRLEIDTFFEEIVISEEVGVEKPDPQIMKIILERCRLSAGECLYVGDHPYDVLCAGRAGMDCAWIASPNAALPAEVPYQEKYRINGVSELVR